VAVVAAVLSVLVIPVAAVLTRPEAALVTPATVALAVLTRPVTVAPAVLTTPVTVAPAVLAIVWLGWAGVLVTVMPFDGAGWLGRGRLAQGRGAGHWRSVQTAGSPRPVNPAPAGERGTERAARLAAPPPAPPPPGSRLRA
jgi:hypothetical protein